MRTMRPNLEAYCLLATEGLRSIQDSPTHVDIVGDSCQKHKSPKSAAKGMEEYSRHNVSVSKQMATVGGQEPNANRQRHVWSMV